MQQSISGYLYVALASALYGSLPILGKIGYSFGLTLPTMLIARYLLASSALFIIIKTLGVKFSWRLSCYTWLQAFFYIGSAVLYFFSLKYLPAGIASVILFTYPAIVAFIGRVVDKKKYSPSFYLALALTLTGIVLLAGIQGGRPSLPWLGLFLALGSALCFALFTYLGNLALENSSPLALTAVLSLVGVVLLSCFFPSGLSGILSLTWPQFLVCLALALFNTVLGLYFFLKGVEKIGPARAALVNTSEPVITLVLAYLILNECLKPLQLLGCLLVISGILISRRQKEKPQHL